MKDTASVDFSEALNNDAIARSVDDKQEIKDLWGQGDWRNAASRLDDAARTLVEAADVRPGEHVLEVAAGTGNGAVWAAKAGAAVMATDLCPTMIDQGRQRTDAEGVNVEWAEADMEDLPFQDGRFDVVLAAFGVPFSFHHETTASELLRVARPTGRVALVNWTPEGWPGKVGEIIAAYLPSKKPAGSLFHWGKESALLPLFQRRKCSISMRREALWSEFPSPEAWWSEWSARLPIMAVARETLTTSAYGRLRDELIRSVLEVANANRTGLRWKSEYLIAVVQKR